MFDQQILNAVISAGRVLEKAIPGDKVLGPLSNLPGTWENADSLVGHGWNLIALPYKEPGHLVNPNTPDQKSDFRLLLNQFNESLEFTTVDKGVQNRGAALHNVFDGDQHVAALQYIQIITQIAAEDFPVTPNTPDTPKDAAVIHHEPGLFLHFLSQTHGGPDIARLGTIPHGDSVLALGSASQREGAPSFDNVGDFSALPVGVDHNLANSYLAPYVHFKNQPFKGLFDPTNPLKLLDTAAQAVKIKSTTTIAVDSTILTAGIRNIPFVVRQANSTAMRSIFWIEELEDAGPNGQPQFQLQYAQKVLLDFFPVGDPRIGLIRWPHISINTLKLTKAATS